MMATPLHNPPTVVRAAQSFFAKIPPARRPPVLRHTGRWVLLTGEDYLALFFLTNKAWAQFDSHRKKGWDPFPGLFAPADGKSLISVEGSGVLFDSNTTSDGYAFHISPLASCVIQGHRHAVPDPEGGRIEYVVDLGFVLGNAAASASPTVEEAFQPLFERLADLWRSRS